MPFKVSEKRKTMSKNNLIILLAVVSVFIGSYAEDGKLLACNTNVTGDVCPPHTSCKQKETGKVEGLCTCSQGFAFNKAFTSNDTYCIMPNNSTTTTITTEKIVTAVPAQITTTTTAVPTPIVPKPIVTTTTTTTPAATTTTTTTTTTKAPEKSNATITTTPSPLPVPAKPEDVQKEKVIEPEHVFGGVLLPLVVVAAFIGGVFLIRKHNLLERAHNYISERRWHMPGSARPNYTNDFDEFDDPLLI